MARDPQQQKSSAARYYGIGLELAAAVVGFTLLGYWIDRHFGTDPWALVICIALGLIGGTYNLIRAALVASRQPPETEGSAGDATGNPPDR